jgi:hypothetical protein
MWAGAQPRPDTGISYWQAFSAFREKKLPAPSNWEDSDWPKTKISGEHHIHYVPSEVLSVSKRPVLANKVASSLKKCLGLSITAVAGMMLFVSVCSDDSAVAFEQMLASADRSSVDGLLASLKTSSSALKQWQHVSGRYEELFETHVLVNRAVGAVDWGDEKAKRMSGPVPEISSDKIRYTARSLFSRARREGKEFFTTKWSDFWEQRWALVPGGSVHSQYDTDMEYVTKERATRNKIWAVSAMPEVEMDYFTSRAPEIHAWPSTKYEWAKMRAIYGCDLTSYLVTEFAMPACEHLLASDVPIGANASLERAKMRLQLADTGDLPFCFDFADFNSQHSLESLQAVLVGFRDVWHDVMTAEQRVAMDWVILSAGQQHVHFSDGVVKLGKTLLSGWRLTTLMNTVLNIAYVEHSGVAGVLQDHVHSGDDVYAQARTVADMDRALRLADLAGIDFQPDKCSGGAISEFLRVDWRAGTDGAQYLTRGCATAVHARPESREALSLRSLMLAAETRMAEIKSRGGDPEVCDALTEISIVRAAQWFGTDPGIAKRMRKAPAPAGGLAIDDMMTPIDTFFKEDATPLRGQYYEMSMNMPGVKAYGSYLARKLGVQREGKFINLVAKANARLVAREPVPVREKPVTDYVQLETDRQLWKTLKGTKLAAMASRLKGLDVSTIRVARVSLDKQTCALLDGIRDPAHWLNVVT